MRQKSRGAAARILDRHERLTLRDVMDTGAGGIDVRLTVSLGSGDDGIIVRSPGGSQLVVVENCGGKLLCHIWATGDGDDPTISQHITGGRPA